MFCSLRSGGEAKRRQVNRDGYVFHPHLLKPAAPDRIEQINLIVQAWRETNTADIEKKTDEVKMKCHALAQETGWTPIQAFSEQVDEKRLQKELKCIRQPVLKQEAESLTGFKCITPKCSKKGLFNFSDRPMPMFCEDHCYEGMVDVVSQTVKGGKDQKSIRGKGVCSNEGTVQDKPLTVQHSPVKGGISDDEFEYTGKGKGKAKSKVHGQKSKGENAKGPGRPTKSETLVRAGKAHKPIQAFFSQSQEQNTESKKPLKGPALDDTSVMEGNLVREGLSRTEARQVAAAMKASMVDGCSQAVGKEEVESVLDANTIKGSRDYPPLLCVPACNELPKQVVNDLRSLWVKRCYYGLCRKDGKHS